MSRAYRNPRMDQKIDDLMQFDHVVAVMPDGRVIDTDEGFNPLDVHAPVVEMGYDGPFEDAQIGKEHDAAMMEHLRKQGWEVLSGYSGQYSYSGPVMHRSEFIGGGLEDRIREEPGFWVALTVEIHPGPEDDDETESEVVGWIVARKIGSEDEIAKRTHWIAEDVAPFHVNPNYRGYRPHTNEDVAMSSPVVYYKGDSEEAARLAMVKALREIAQFNHVRMANESHCYMAAAERIESGEKYAVQPGHRIQRVRALLMPKESE